MAQPSIADIAALLNDRIADLALTLLGKPNWALSTKKQLRYGTKGSIAIEIDGPKKGCWYDHERGIGGAGLELIADHQGIKVAQALDWARNWLGPPAFKTPSAIQRGRQQ